MFSLVTLVIFNIEKEKKSQAYFALKILSVIVINDSNN